MMTNSLSNSLSQSTENAGQWYVIYTKPNEQERADFNLRAWGIETFNPKVKRATYNEFTGKPSYTSKPLFPRYIFARFDAERKMHKVHFTRGVSCILNFGQGPAMVDDEIIQFLRSQTGTDGFVKPREELNPGDAVVVREGPLKDLSGVLQDKVKGSDRVRILLATLNYQGSVVIEREYLKKVV